MSGVNRFMQPVKANYFQTYVSQYVPQPFELMQRAVDNAQKHQDAIATNIEKQQAFLGKLKTHTGADTTALEQYTNLYQTQFDDIMAGGDLRQKEDQVRKLARQLGEDYRTGPLGRYVQSGNIEANYIKAAAEAEGKNLGSGGWGTNLKGYLGDYHRYWQQHGYGDNFDQAVTTKTDRGTTDIGKKVSDAQKMVTEDTLGIIDQAGGQFNEYYRWIQGNIKGITDSKATAVIMGVLANDQDVMHDARINAIMKNKGNMNAAEFEKSISEEELGKLTMKELAIFADPGIKGKVHKIKTQTSKFLGDEEAGARARKVVEEGYKDPFGMDTVNVVDNETGRDFNAFADMRDGKAQKGVDDAATDILMNVLGKTPDTFILKDALRAGAFGQRLDDKAVGKILTDLKAGKGIFSKVDSEIRRQQYVKLKNAQRVLEQTKERSNNAMKFADQVIAKNNPKLIKDQKQITNEFGIKSGLAGNVLAGTSGKEFLNKDIQEVVQNAKDKGVKFGSFDLTPNNIENYLALKLWTKKGNIITPGLEMSDVIKFAQKESPNFGQKASDLQSSVLDLETAHDDAYIKYIDETGSRQIVDKATNNLPDIKVASKRDEQGNVTKETTVTGQEQLESFAKNFTGNNAGRLNNVVLRDAKNQPIDSGDEQNLQYIAEQLEIDDKGKIPDPSNFLVGTNPSDKQPYVQMTYFNDKNGKSFTTKMNFNDYISAAGISKQNAADWGARIRLTSAQESPTGSKTYMYDDWQDKIPNVYYNSDNNSWYLGDIQVTYEKAKAYTTGYLLKKNSK